MATIHDARRVSRSVFGIEQLQGDLRARGFDLQRTALVTYLVNVGADRATAYALHAEAVGDGWQSSLYVDDTGWVVRIVRTGPALPQRLSADIDVVAALAAKYDAILRGLIVEDAEPDDRWQSLGAGVEDTPAEHEVALTEQRTGHVGERRAVS